MRSVHLLATVALMLGCATTPALANEAVGQQVDAQGWVSHAEAESDKKPVVLHFRREVSLADVPDAYRVRVTADNRFVLYVNGRRVAAGPSTGDVAHWREEQIDLAPFLSKGQNIVAAVVWDGVKPLSLPENPTVKQIEAANGASLFTNTAPLFQQNVATGFRLVGEGRASAISTDRGGWRVKLDRGHSFANGWAQLRAWYYVAGMPEIIDAADATFDWKGAVETGTGWQDAVAAPAAAARTLIRDPLPEQRYELTHVGQVVRTDLPGGEAFPQRAVTVPANSTVKLLIQRDVMTAAYPELSVSGGAGATIKVTWSEALYDEDRRKGDRDIIADRKPIGIWDTFIADGAERTFAPLWWRTWRYAEIEVQTSGEPLTLTGMRAFATGYPFQQVGRFSSDDPEHRDIFDIGWRTAQIDAHETYMDTAFWEQLQYAGDTRLQMLISYAVSGDTRLAEQAIEAFAASNVFDGLIEAAYPTRGSNVIATFALMWVGMLDDWRMRQPDTKPITRNLSRMREVLDRFADWQQPSGLLGRNEYWNFIDWVGQPATDRTDFPSYGTTNESCLLSVLWLGALQQGARIEAELGDDSHASRYAGMADDVKQAIVERCWKEDRGLFADNPSGDRFSQHMNALAIMYDVVDQENARAILEKIVAPAQGIDAPAGITPTSYYFSWYLIRAFQHAGMPERYHDLLKTWRGLLELNYTTWPEERDTEKASTRSDSHAWSAHPTADLLGIVAGIQPGAPGYSRLKVAPSLGDLKQLQATAATPKGPVRVKYEARGDRLRVEIERPRDLPGEFVWKSQVYPLRRVKSRFTVPLN